ncbi:MAG: hypothetical protein ACREO8_03545 [Luteimonas sp.]
MNLRLAQLPLIALLAFGVAAGAHAQGKPASASRAESAVLPVWNTTNGKVEAYLLLEPANGTQAGTRWRFGGTTLDAAFGLPAGDSLALMCRQSGISSALGSLANNCMLAALDDDATGNGGSRRTSATASLGRGGSRLGLIGGNSRDTLPAWLTGNRAASSQIDINDLSVYAQQNLGREGWVEIAGTTAKARLLSPAEASTFGLSDQWSSKTLSIGGGYGAFAASIVGHVIDTPGKQKWEGLGLGLTWRTPWRGQLTVGADNLVTRGKNPFSPTSQITEDEGAVPYVRYEQDL